MPSPLRFLPLQRRNPKLLTMKLLRESLVRSYLNGSNYFEVRKDRSQIDPSGFTFLVKISNQLAWIPPSFVPTNIVSRQDLISIITEMSV